MAPDAFSILSDSYFLLKKPDNVGRVSQTAEDEVINHELSLIEQATDFGKTSLASPRRVLPHSAATGDGEKAGQTGFMAAALSGAGKPSTEDFLNTEEFQPS